MDKPKISNFMLLLANDRDSSEFIKRIGEAIERQFVNEWQTILKHLATSLILSVIKERFGDRVYEYSPCYSIKVSLKDIH